MKAKSHAAQSILSIFQNILAGPTGCLHDPSCLYVFFCPFCIYVGQVFHCPSAFPTIHSETTWFIFPMWIKGQQILVICMVSWGSLLRSKLVLTGTKLFSAVWTKYSCYTMCTLRIMFCMHTHDLTEWVPFLGSILHAICNCT